MVKGKKKAKASIPKRGRAGDARSASVPSKHDKTAERVAATAVAKPIEQTPTQPGTVGSKVVGFTNLGNTCFFNSVLQVATLALIAQFVVIVNMKLVSKFSYCSYGCNRPKTHADLICYLLSPRSWLPVLPCSSFSSSHIHSCSKDLWGEHFRKSLSSCRMVCSMCYCCHGCSHLDKNVS